MKKFKFTIASELYSGAIVVIGIDPGGNYHPWTRGASEAAIKAGADCGCGRCHNCQIFALIDSCGWWRGLTGQDLEYRFSDWWQQTRPTMKGALSL